MRSSSGPAGRGLVVVAVLALATAARADRAVLLDVGKDVLLERAFVPSAQRPQGEVRIIRRGGHAVVQTLLYTRVLKRVLAAISDKERRNWPAGSAGHADMERYVAALEAFRLAAAKRTGQPAGGDDRQVRALIEFVDVPGAPFVAIGGVDIEGSGEAVRIRGRAAPAVLDFSPHYVQRNMRLIVADAFHISEERAATRLAKAVAP